MTHEIYYYKYGKGLVPKITPQQIERVFDLRSEKEGTELKTKLWKPGKQATLQPCYTRGQETFNSLPDFKYPFKSVNHDQ